MLACIVACAAPPPPSPVEKPAAVPAASSAVPSATAPPSSMSSVTVPAVASVVAPAPTADENGLILPWPPTVVPAPKIAPPPVSSAAFVAAGCVELSGGAGLDCGRARGLPADACHFGIRRNDALGGLSATVSVYQCWAADARASDMFHAGGLADAVMDLVVAEHGRVVIVRSRAELLARFGPVDTPEKALAFAVTFTNGHPMFDAALPPRGNRVYVSRIEGTRVAPSGGGWEVNLFSRIVFGCGLHPEVALDVHVDRSGAVEVTRQTPLDANPESKSCVD